jgi:hypothetical protein
MQADDSGAHHGEDREPIDEQSRAQAIEVLRDALGWELSAERWEQVEQIISATSSALAANDARFLRQALTELELYDPVR